MCTIGRVDCCRIVDPPLQAALGVGLEGDGTCCRKESTALKPDVGDTFLLSQVMLQFFLQLCTYLFARPYLQVLALECSLSLFM